MAHQAHNIPWNTMASNLRWRKSNSCQGGATNFHFSSKPEAGKEMKYFINALGRNIKDHAETERRKFPEQYEAPGGEEVIITDEVARKITPTVLRWRNCPDRYGEFDKGPLDHNVCRPGHGDGHDFFEDDESWWQYGNCRCALPFEERKMTAFLRDYKQNSCYEFFNYNKRAFFNLEVVNTLLHYGEMDTILRICSHPSIQLAQWNNIWQCYCGTPDMGWNFVGLNALQSYMILNIIYCIPETWDGPTRNERDYRDTSAYQKVVREVTASDRTSDLPNFPHRDFFGIARGQFRDHYKLRDKTLWPPWAAKDYGTSFPTGHRAYEEMLQAEKIVADLPYTPDVPQIKSMLGHKGLPPELADMILDMNSSHGKRRLKVSHDPFHPENRQELLKYLKYCWQLVIRTEVLARALQVDMGWEQVIGETIMWLFECSCPGRKQRREACGLHHGFYRDPDSDYATSRFRG